MKKLLNKQNNIKYFMLIKATYLTQMRTKVKKKVIS